MIIRMFFPQTYILMCVYRHHLNARIRRINFHFLPQLP